MRLTWFLTVFSARNRCAAISPLVRPPAISDMTSISRADRPRLVCSSTCTRVMRPPVKPVRAKRKHRRPAMSRPTFTGTDTPKRSGSNRQKRSKGHRLPHLARSVGVVVRPVGGGLADLGPAQQPGGHGLALLQRVEKFERL